MRSNRERGSVLVLCLGILVVLALMATAFISSVEMHRSTAKNQHVSGLVRIAALAGRNHAIKCIRDNQGNNTSFSDEWYTAPSGGGLAETATDIWSHYSIADISPTSTDIQKGAAASSPSYYELEKYGEDMLKPDATASGTIQVRYVFHIVDLSGCLNDSTLAGGPFYSWDHIRAVNSTDGVDLFNMTPFGPQDQVNINTISKKLLLVLIDKADLANATDDMTPAEEEAMADTIIATRATPYTSVDPQMTGQFGTDPQMTVAQALSTGGAGQPKLVAQPSDFYRIVVRAQVYDTANAKVLGESELETVYHTGATDGNSAYIAYQRWLP